MDTVSENVVYPPLVQSGDSDLKNLAPAHRNIKKINKNEKIYTFRY